jgi:sortase B
MNHKKRTRNFVNRRLVCAVILLVFICCWMLKKYRNGLRDDAAIDSQRRQKPTMASAAPGTEPGTGPDMEPSPDAPVSGDAPPLMDFSELRSENGGIWAWLIIDGTEIDYPVVQAENNSYYLPRDARRNYNKNGALFLDYRVRSDFSDFNNVIYGHHMKSGRMFQNLVLFKDLGFFDGHSTGFLYTSEKTYRLTIFAVALTAPSEDYYEYVFVSPSDREKHLSMIKNTAMYYRDGIVTEKDRILCLSTCSYEYAEARTVVLAKLEAL